ncbi:ATP12 family chaperone protein [Pseudooctadecabacter jejudonensis]|uniref:ATP12 chaperone protein n=1 Tax=Pseudooctadecabacter jejudonensis TaxID=1391910 RepID=A0A1Y5S1R0_9RHOB|nr:ATP12 family protein [Pseudooctadecabacter jejudonensis]SLN27935.1 ATP12 chaperone protein [Pseudooctadecabacter jejudonensis]
MSAWAAKRFWTDVNVVPADGGFAVQLDTRPVKTPAKSALIVPTEALAEAVADEWRAVEDGIDPNVMPFTRSANAAIDKVATQFTEVADMLAAYGGSDLLCYRATHPDPLVARQAATWDPLLDWAHETFGARLLPTSGIMPVDQSQAALSALSAPLYLASPFQLTALHDLIALSGSLVIGLAVAQGRLGADEGWNMSRLDEIWQAEQWGADEEAEAAAAIKHTAFVHALTFYKLTTSSAEG